MTGENKYNGSNARRGDQFRNLCIMAHVDHGKTTLADSLIASNGIISEKQAGEIKYMDSRPDEMERGITMKSSCITLAYPYRDQNYLINLIDSPGHVDFSSEVSTALRLCDGCILVVDVVEGVCAQTKAVMRQAWVAGVKPVLVLNKIDRLILEQELTPLDAYYHLTHVLQQVNAYMGELYNTDVLGRTNVKSDKKSSSSSSNTQQPASAAESTNQPPADASRKDISDWSIEDIDDTNLYFNPTQGSVLFTSAIHGWGFGINHFAKQFSEKLGMSYATLIKTLWGDYYISSKGGNKRIMKGARDKRKNPLFVTLILDNLYQLYRKVRPPSADVEEVKRIASSLGVEVPQRMLESSSESKARFIHICSNWLPLAAAVLGMVIDELPPPTRLTEERARKLLTTATLQFDSLPIASQRLTHHLQQCSIDIEAPLVVYVSKMFGVSCKKLREAELKLEERKARANGTFKEPGPRPPKVLQDQTDTPNSAEDCDVPDVPQEEDDVEELLAFARVFSGSLKAGQEVYVLGPKHNPSAAMQIASPDGKLTEQALESCPYITKCKVGGVFLLLGREVTCLGSASAGMLIGVSGLERHVIKSASLSDTVACPPFTHVLDASSAVGGGGCDPSGSILRVQVIPKDPRCLPKLRHGLRLLNQADPCVQVWLEGTGEYMIGAAGEVHLQRCLTDLQERYARTEVTSSEAIVPFRETVVPRPLVDQTNEAMQGDNASETQQSGDGSVSHCGVLGSLRVRVLALPPAVTELLFTNPVLLSALAAQGEDAQQRPNMTSSGSRDLDENEDGENKSMNLCSRSSSEIVNSSNKFSTSDIDSIANESQSTNDSLIEATTALSTTEVTDCNLLTTDTTELTNVNTQSLVFDPLLPKSRGGGMEPLQQQRRSFLNAELSEETQVALSVLKHKLSQAFEDAGPEWAGAVDQIWSVGPQHSGPNVLLNRSQDYKRPSVWQARDSLPAGAIANMDQGLVTAFQLTTSAGPLCEEPLMGTCFVVDQWTPPNVDAASLPPGKVLAVARELLVRAMEEQPRRMMAAMYSCVVTVTQEVVGRVYSVLGKRHGRVLHGDITEGSTSWNVTALLPIVESIDFANELRKATSGEAQPQLVFSHWEVLELDPYWDPCTEEELKHFGEKADTDNLARHYMNAVRRRKGIREYGKKLVEYGEKQRTLSKNK